MNRSAIILLCVCVASTGSDALAGDEDKPPPYKIYIDPDTGKYTTEDPFVQLEDGPIVSAVPQPAITVDESGRAAAMLSGILIIGLIAAAVLLYRRQPTT